MPRPTTHAPERGEARTRLLAAARDIIRAKGFAATTVDDLCRAAEVTKGAFFHHFESKEALGVAAADYWSETTGALFAAAPYHAPPDPLDRVLAYVAFRKAIIAGTPAEFTCLAGTMIQEVHDTSDAIRDACGRAILGHAATLFADIEAARREYGVTADWTAPSLARHTQAVLQGAFILAKAGDDAELARESVDHLDRYIRQLFNVTQGGPSVPEEKIEIENINTPGRTERVNRAKCEAMRDALLAVLPDAPPGLKVSEAKAALLPLLPDELFPAGDKAGWWLKAVQLDLEAKGLIKRAPSKPVQLFRVTSARPPITERKTQCE